MKHHSKKQAARREQKTVFREAHGRNIDLEETGYRRLTDGKNRRDLPEHQAARMREIALHLWRTNPLANRIIELPLAFILSDGVTLKIDDLEAQGWLDAFWRDPINRMGITLFEMVRELALYGELYWVAFVNEHSGHVRLGYLDPERVEAVVRDPDNGRQAIGVITRADEQGVKRRYRVVINGTDDELLMPEAIRLRESCTDGDIFYFAVNNVSTSGGHSDLLALADWIDGYEQFLYGEVERSAHLRAHVYDVTLTGATPEEVDRKARSIVPPAPGGVRVHNEAEKWEAVSPNLQAADTTEVGRMFRNHALGGATIPEHWFGGGGDVNRATGESMSDPTTKIFTVRQKLIQYFLEELGSYVVRRRLESLARPMPDPEDAAWRVRAEFPEMIVKDVSKYAAALQQVVAACASAVDAGLMSRDTALSCIRSVATRLGVEYDAGQELDKVDASMDAAREADNFQPPPVTV
ncbi:hypothetical protein SIID45300_02397 [Candidatus Magnetaquicoccaceae bacterium FCR-1]|uniref:Phage portal protein n=1 Tax=Candidatus Magnetaquiglobus chichijimensis TaxID=3141448 RepID=A0ABQ0CB01_9PROT